jgi:hypothetical protein
MHWRNIWNSHSPSQISLIENDCWRTTRKFVLCHVISIRRIALPAIRAKIYVYGRIYPTTSMAQNLLKLSHIRNAVYGLLPDTTAQYLGSWTALQRVEWVDRHCFLQYQLR